MVFKKVRTWDNQAKLLRVFRLMWERGSVGDGKGYSAKLSFAVWASKYGILHYNKEEGGGKILSVLGLRFHFVRSYGGRFV